MSAAGAFAQTIPATPAKAAGAPSLPAAGDRPSAAMTGESLRVRAIPPQSGPHSFVSPTLQALPQINNLPQTQHNPTKAEAPTVIHTGNWGVFNRDDGSPAGFGPVARYGTARWAEDWRALRDPANRVDPFDALKFIPFTDDKTVYLTLSGETRVRNWFETRPFLGQQKPDDSGRFTFRNLYAADLHVGNHFRVYAELINGDAAGWNGYGYNASYRTRLDLQQIFGEFKARVAGARTGVILGRQQFLDAPNYVLFARETPNVPLSWNGGRAYAVWDRFRLDAWDFVQTNTTPQQMFRDNENWNARLWGAYSSWAPPDFDFLGRPAHVFLDFFYIGYLFGGTPAAIATPAGTQNGSTIRHNVGDRFWGKAGPIEFSLGAIYQGGEFRYARSDRTRTVDAWAVNSFAGWRFSKVYGRPLVALQVDVYSGGGYSSTSGSEHTYVAPYNPSTNYLDTTTYIAPSNLVSVAPTFEFTPSRYTVLRFKTPLFWREDASGAVYGASRIYSFRQRFSGGFIGAAPQGTFAWRITPHLTWSHDLARFMTSRSLEKAGGSDGTYYLSSLAFRF
ncbi:alginate export family protein [Rhizosaccharibacter radicis]|uniref:Alginate export family protein n=1 Tax=Rhizosaccharibacter radicis TaxID=2782605 RepID=A0ABT1W152_9PROT|nr:alginate export family protein [Acetobacteraceae bacterium KSS12]